MLKWLLVIAVVAGVYYFFIKKSPVKSFKGGAKEMKDSDEMVECFTCKTYCSADEAFIKQSRFYCSKECMEA